MATPTSPDWTCIDNAFPPEKALIDAMRSDGEVVRLRFSKGLFWFEDMSMYCYYVPRYWRVV